MPSTRIRTFAPALAACAALAGASALPATAQTRSPNLESPSIIVRPVATNAALEGHSNGRPGSLTDGDCEVAAHEYNEEKDEAVKAIGTGDFRKYASALNMARMTLEWFRAGGCVPS